MTWLTKLVFLVATQIIYAHWEDTAVTDLQMGHGWGLLNESASVVTCRIYA